MRRYVLCAAILLVLANAGFADDQEKMEKQAGCASGIWAS
jgi:hypothetical protein